MSGYSPSLLYNAVRFVWTFTCTHAYKQNHQLSLNCIWCAKWSVTLLWKIANGWIEIFQIIVFLFLPCSHLKLPTTLLFICLYCILTWGFSTVYCEKMQLLAPIDIAFQCKCKFGRFLWITSCCGSQGTILCFSNIVLYNVVLHWLPHKNPELSELFLILSLWSLWKWLM